MMNDAFGQSEFGSRPTHATSLLAFMRAMRGIDWTPPSRAPIFRTTEEVTQIVLHEFLESKRGDIIARTKVKVQARPAPRVTDTELTEGVPLFVDQLILTLKGSVVPEEMNAAATKHGSDMLCRGFTIGQVVHDYGDVCQAVTELAFELNAQITVDEFHTLNRCLDDAIADAVTEYARLREQSRADEETERLGALAGWNKRSPSNTTPSGKNSCSLIERRLHPQA